jgi:catechol 2,3-dioxygenase-like lactoylglutathione lyase family enzyme
MTVQLSGGGPEIGIVVRDLEPMLHFYRDFLGFEVYKERDFPGFHLVWMRCGGGAIKLVQLSPTPEATSPAEVWGATGLRYITLVVDNIDEIADAVESAGARVAYRRSNEEVTNAMLQDPEGNHVELAHWNDTERLEGAK